MDFTNDVGFVEAGSCFKRPIIKILIFFKNMTRLMKPVLFISTWCFQNILCLLSDFNANGKMIQFHNLVQIREQFYNFTYFSIIGVFWTY